MKSEEDLIVELTTELSSPADAHARCPICGVAVPISELRDHSNAHFAAEDDVAVNLIDSPLLSEVPVACPLCGQMLSVDEIDSHAVAHSIELEGLDEHAIADDIYYAELRKTYGSPAIRGGGTGTCYICGEAGHWARDCPKNPEYIIAPARVLPQPTAAAVAAVQLPDPQFQRPPFDPEQMLRLLGQCTTKQYLPKEFSTCTTMLCGTVVHFGGQRLDRFWGCGYRNIQMISAHLLITDELSAKTLFSGSQFVPDIPSLQAWIEVAWRAGFDSVGAEQLERQLQGGKKWIGTTEAAALFRYFGIHATIIDFGASSKEGLGLYGSGDYLNKQQQQKPPQRHQMSMNIITDATASTSATAAKEGKRDSSESAEAGEVHSGVECDVCGSFPIQGERFKSQVLPNYDVCSDCLKINPEINAAAGPFSRVPVSLPGNLSEQMPKSTKDAFYADPLKRDASAAAALTSAHALGVTLGGMAGQGLALGDNNRSTLECSPAGKSLLHWVWEYFSQGDFAAIAEDPGCVGHGTDSSGTTQPSAAAAAAAPAAVHPLPPPGLHLSRGGPGRIVKTHYTSLCPLYLQHEGHSRTIIGVEKKERPDGTFEITLLLLDPGVPPPALHDALVAGIKWQRLIKRNAATLNKLQYQVLYCPRGAVPATPGSTHYEALKILSAQEKL
ncbi:hypothetical protein Ndes2437A_g04687 [Nannochloris sp. 'desiccata']|nr:hypothetical protein KSW81_004469 [Chlorella desiccata (nom. nud.)]